MCCGEIAAVGKWRFTLIPGHFVEAVESLDWASYGFCLMSDSVSLLTSLGM